jgi:hypothetical protein
VDALSASALHTETQKQAFEGTLMPTTLPSGRQPVARIKDDSLNELRQLIDVVLISIVGLLLTIDVILCFPDLGCLVERYNQF